MLVAIFAAAVAIFVAVVVQDLRQRQVSNLFCVGIAGLGIIRWGILMQITPAAWAVAAAVVVFFIGALLNARNWLGGGDVKLISATTLLLGCPDGAVEDIIRFLFLVSLIGSFLAVILMIRLLVIRLRAGRAAPLTRSAMTESSGTENSAATSDFEKVPYAVAVALAAVVVLFLQVQRA